jgi:hypothetical protein
MTVTLKNMTRQRDFQHITLYPRCSKVEATKSNLQIRQFQEATMFEEKTFQWKPVLWAAILIFVLSSLLVSAVPAVYGTYIGFQTRGDMELVNAGVESVIQSSFFPLYYHLVLAAIGLWQGSVLAKKAKNRVGWHVGAAVGVTLLFSILADLFLGNGVIQWQNLIFQALALLSGAYLGAYLRLYLVSRKASTA